MDKKIVESDTTHKKYYPDDTVRIVNLEQIAAYLENDVELLDIYTSRDYKTKKRILVAVFDKTASFDAYQKWCKHEL